MENQQLGLIWDASKKWLLITLGASILLTLASSVIPGSSSGSGWGSGSLFMLVGLAFLSFIASFVVLIVGIHKSHRNYEALTGTSDISLGDAIKIALFFLVALSIPGIVYGLLKPGAFSSPAVSVETGALAIIALIVMSVVYVIMVISLLGTYRLYKKAEQPGWAVMVPIYGTICLLRAGKKPEWWILLFFIPFVNIIFAVMAVHAISKAFGKDGGFTVGLIFLPFIFFPLLGFGEEPRWIYSIAPDPYVDIENHLVD